MNNLLFINILNIFSVLTDKFFAPIDSYIESFNLVGWVNETLIESLHLIPFLFIVFIFVEIFEYYFSNKMGSMLKFSKKAGPVLGSFLASFPQCGFSVVAATLYVKKIISPGTLIAIFIATSDEAIPVLFMYPDKIKFIWVLLLIKILLGVLSGYLVDFLLGIKNLSLSNASDDTAQEGCCKHHLNVVPNRFELLWHPIKHTISVFIFILVFSLLISYVVNSKIELGSMAQNFIGNGFVQPIYCAFLGLIPNCAASVAVVMLYIKGLVPFGALISGLSSSAGLGLLVLLKKNSSIKDTMKIIGILFFISILAGEVIQLLSL